MLIPVTVIAHGYRQLMHSRQPFVAAEFFAGIGLVRPVGPRRFVGRKMMEEMAI